MNPTTSSLLSITEIFKDFEDENLDDDFDEETDDEFDDDFGDDEDFEDLNEEGDDF